MPKDLTVTEHKPTTGKKATIKQNKEQHRSTEPNNNQHAGPSRQGTPGGKAPPGSTGSTHHKHPQRPDQLITSPHLAHNQKVREKQTKPLKMRFISRIKHTISSNRYAGKGGAGGR
ncbi:hypothetical protein BDQ17DRAFT_1342607, partial [Cyathus striatus]